MRKYIVLVVLIVSAAFAAEITRVEKLTEVEKTRLVLAQTAVREAQEKLEQVKKEIKEAHKMYDADYCWRGFKCEISGDYILQYEWQSQSIINGNH